MTIIVTKRKFLYCYNLVVTFMYLDLLKKKFERFLKLFFEKDENLKKEEKPLRLKNFKQI